MAKGLTTNGDGHIAGLTVTVFQEFQPELLEDDDRVFGRDPLRPQFTPLDEVPADVPTPWCAGNWDAHVRSR